MVWPSSSSPSPRPCSPLAGPTPQFERVSCRRPWRPAQGAPSLSNAATRELAPFLLFPSAAAGSPCLDSSHGIQVLCAAMPVQKQQPSLALSSTPQHRHCPCLSAVQIPATSLAEHCPAAACSFASRVGCSTNRRSEPCPPASFRSPVRDDAFVFTPRVQQPRLRFDVVSRCVILLLDWIYIDMCGCDSSFVHRRDWFADVLIIC